ncbi:MAG: hypothetical protein CMM01_19905 [Rhodopirellula sp.]|nr:hypothetical protein [Rhodopirellula sp.]
MSKIGITSQSHPQIRERGRPFSSEFTRRFGLRTASNAQRVAESLAAGDDVKERRLEIRTAQKTTRFNPETISAFCGAVRMTKHIRKPCIRPRCKFSKRLKCKCTFP